MITENNSYKQDDNWYIRCACCRTQREASQAYGMINVMVGNIVLAIVCTTCIPKISEEIRKLFPKGGLPVIDETGKEVEKESKDGNTHSNPL